MDIRRLNKEDFQLLAKISKTYKGKEITSQYAKDFLENESNILIAPIIENEAKGFLIAYKLERIDREEKMMFFYEIEVDKEFRRQGLASAMVRKLKEICKKEDCYKMYVPTNKSNIPATNLYKSTGGKEMSEDDVIFNYIFEK